MLLMWIWRYLPKNADGGDSQVLRRAYVIGPVFKALDDVNMIRHNLKSLSGNGQALTLVAGVTRLELATFPSSLTGRSNQSFNI